MTAARGIREAGLMPILRAGRKLIYFAHVPKCGGTSVNDYLACRFGPLAFLDRKYMSLDERARWSKTSPQHVEAASLARLFPPGFFDATFALVRDPVERLVSAYHFDLDAYHRDRPQKSFRVWLRQGLRQLAGRPRIRDNHLRPMCEMVPEGARVFRLEDGMAAVERWLDEVTGTSWDGPGIGVENARSQRRSARGPRAVPGAPELALIASVYAEDYATFGYPLPAAAAEARS